ncbi:MAG: thiamine pyrophosphate-binding protein [Pseudomonadota bacterium]
MTDLSASDVIARRLAEAGCRFAFGIPGGEVLALTDALDRAGIAVVLSRHENCAGFMGEGAWHGGAGPAILFATIGPGVANAVNVIANAWQDRVPMIVLTGCVTAADAHTYTHQVFDHVALLAPVTKAAFRVEPGTAAVVVEKALSIAMEGRPGPVVLDFPIDVQREVRPAWPVARAVAAAPTAPAGEALAEARTWIAEAKRPLVIAGLDAVVQGAEGVVADFCRAHHAPLITTYKAKGILPEDDPLSLGAAGLSPVADAELLPLVAEADCVILAGYDPIEMRVGWRDPFAPGQRVIEVAAASNDHFMHQASQSFVADIAAGLVALTVGGGATWPPDLADGVRTRLRAAYSAEAPWGPAAIVDAAEAALPAETVVTVDSGAHRIVFSQVWRARAPRSVLQSSGLCTMGAAVPLAIGRKLAEPDRPVVAFVGDAGVEMFLGELATARDHRLSLPVVVFIDVQLALIELKQRGAQMPEVGVTFGATDFPAVAEALGGAGIWVETREALAEALQAALARDTFSLIAARIGRRDYDGRI